MLGDKEGVASAQANATRALTALPSTVPKTGVFAIALAEHPPYTATSLLLSGQLREAATVTQGIIDTAYPIDVAGNRESSSYARTLLILGMAEAGLGRVDEAAAAGMAALTTSGAVWPTLVLAGKLDEMFTTQSPGSASATQYHLQYQATAQQFQHQSPAATEKPG
jgi:hypothetical protein